MSKKQQQSQSALGTVLLRNAFYRDCYKRVLLGVFLLIILNLFLGMTIMYKVMYPVSPNYFPATADGRLIPVKPLSEPVVSNAYVEQWAADALSDAFRLDFVHWREQLANARVKFTPQGWKWFLESLKASKNLNTLRGKDMVSSVRVTTPPRVIRSLVIDGTFMWKIELNVMITYQNINQKLNMPEHVTIVIVRMPVKDYHDRIAVNNIIMSTYGKSRTRG